jgi:betaine-aldehyde dehydrogenase
LAQDGVGVALGGLPPATGPLAGGYYVTPTVLTNVQNSWRVAQEEIFGPVICAIPFEDEDDVIALANDTRYGLSCFVWTHDLGQALRSAHRVNAGWVQVNQGGGQVLGQSYGGYKRSGMGREFSLEGMVDTYTQRKHVSISIQR